MPAPTPTPTRPYVSRRKRRSAAQDPSSVGNKLTFGLIGLLLLGLLVSLGIIATHLVSPTPEVANNVGLVTPAPMQQ